MRYSNTSGNSGYAYGSLPSGIKGILIANVVVFFLQIIFSRLGFPLYKTFGLSSLALENFYIFQVFTYMWLHSTDQFMHILFNLFGIWMFGRELEYSWGTKQFLKYYIVSGVGAGFVILLLDVLFGPSYSSTIGASGALYGLLLASAMSWPDREVYLYFLFPIKMKFLVIGFGAISFLGLISGGNNISHAGHLGGLLAGYLYVLYKRHGWNRFFQLRKNPQKSSTFRIKMKNLDNVINIQDVKKGRQGATDAPRTEREIKEDIWKKKRVDELLDRISLYGINSLTDDEKKFLNQVSNEYKSRDSKNNKDNIH